MKHHVPVFFKETAPKKKLSEEVDVKQVIADLIDTKWSSSDEEEMKGVLLLKGLATSKDPAAKKFMQDLDALTSKMSKADYE